MKFYRYVIVEYAELDSEQHSPRIPNPTILLNEYDLYKETPKGYWIVYGWERGYTKWVSKTATRRFAYPTKKEAMINLTKRTERRLKIIKWQKRICEIVLDKIKENKI